MLLFCGIPAQADFGAMGSRFAGDPRSWWLKLLAQLAGAHWICWCWASVVPRATRVSTYMFIPGLSVTVGSTRYSGWEQGIKERRGLHVEWSSMVVDQFVLIFARSRKVMCVLVGEGKCWCEAHDACCTCEVWPLLMLHPTQVVRKIDLSM